MYRVNATLGSVLYFFMSIHAFDTSKTRCVSAIELGRNIDFCSFNHEYSPFHKQMTFMSLFSASETYNVTSVACFHKHVILMST